MEQLILYVGVCKYVNVYLILVFFRPGHDLLYNNRLNIIIQTSYKYNICNKEFHYRIRKQLFHWYLGFKPFLTFYFSI